MIREHLNFLQKSAVPSILKTWGYSFRYMIHLKKRLFQALPLEYKKSGYPYFANNAACDSCKECARICPTQCITVTTEDLTINFGSCITCNLCEDVCPTGVLICGAHHLPIIRSAEDLLFDKAKLLELQPK